MKAVDAAVASALELRDLKLLISRDVATQPAPRGFAQRDPTGSLFRERRQELLCRRG